MYASDIDPALVNWGKDHIHNVCWRMGLLI
jgi:hypothetical protein